MSGAGRKFYSQAAGACLGFHLLTRLFWPSDTTHHVPSFPPFMAATTVGRDKDGKGFEDA